jgi:uncharacterized protein
MKLELEILQSNFSVCQLEPGAPLPAWADQGQLLAVTRTTEELSIVAESNRVPKNVHAEHGWQALKVAGPLDFSLVGILASLATTLADAGVSIFAISTFNTDYLLVKAQQLDEAVAALQRAGHEVLAGR